MNALKEYEKNHEKNSFQLESDVI